MPRPTRRRQRGGNNRDYILNIINPVTLESPTVQYEIVTPESNFVVITYWWGRDNQNKNLGRPCPPSLPAEGTVLPTYDQMIDTWVATCRAAGVNYMAIEYNQFHLDQKYQEAINAKPYFIKKALELCAPRAVLYIDGDMTVNNYPAIFDLKDVDFMARNWNCDPRARDDYEENPGADFYTFETSGGIMYFGQTNQAHSLLDAWIVATEQPGMDKKADDRILSLIFNNLRMYLPINFIQLPIEYLWLSLHYGVKPLGAEAMEKMERNYAKALSMTANTQTKKILRAERFAIRKGYMDMSPIKVVRTDKTTFEEPWSYVFIEHPHCLTTEEIARERSKSSVNRYPITYHQNVTERVHLRSGGIFNDYIFFDSAEQAKAFLPYMYYADTHILYYDEYKNEKTGETEEEEVPLIYHERYEHRYGKYNTIADKNIQMVYQLNQIMHKAPSSKKMSEACRAATSRLNAPCKIVSHATLQNGTVPEILYYLQKGLNVLYVPSKANPIYVDAIIEEANQGNNQFITVNVSRMKDPNNPIELYSEYRLTIPKNAPIYFSHTSKILMHLLLTCKTLDDLSKHFNESFVFLTRIRCKWVAFPPTPTVRGTFMEPLPLRIATQAAQIPQEAINNQAGAELADALINPETAVQQLEVITQMIEEDSVITRNSQIPILVNLNLANRIKNMKLGGRRRRHTRKI